MKIKNLGSRLLGSVLLSSMLLFLCVGFVHAEKPQDENSEYFYEVLCELRSNKKRVVVGEPVIVDILIYMRGNVGGPDGIQVSKIPGFSVQEEKDLKKYQEIKNGNVFVVVRKRLKLIPQTKGSHKIEPVNVVYRVRQEQKHERRSSFFGDSFFSSMFSNSIKQEIESTNALTLHVGSLPVNSQRVDAVGIFSRFETKADKTEVDLNEPIRFVWEAEGSGNLDYITAPKLSFPSFFKSYESKTETIEDENDLQKKGTKRFEFVLQISKVGESRIPAQEFTYFDTKAREYKTLRSQPISINVRNVVSSESQERKTKKKIKKEEQEELEQDINFIEEDASVGSTSKKQIPSWLFLLILIFVPVFTYSKKIKHFLLKLYTLLNAKKENTFDLHKKELNRICEKGKCDELYRFFLTVAADVFDISPANINEDLIEEYVIKHNWPQEKVKDLLAFLSQCAQVAFLNTETTSVQELLKQANHWLAIFEKLNEHSKNERSKKGVI
jgi:hypothetical protein